MTENIGKKFIYDKELQRVIPYEEWLERQAAKRSARAGYYIKDDTMDPLVNPADGRTYDSKSAFERATKEQGCEIIGNEYRGKTLEELAPREPEFSDPMPIISELMDTVDIRETPHQRLPKITI